MQEVEGTNPGWTGVLRFRKQVCGINLLPEAELAFVTCKKVDVAGLTKSSTASTNPAATATDLRTKYYEDLVELINISSLDSLSLGPVDIAHMITSIRAKWGF